MTQEVKIVNIEFERCSAGEHDRYDELLAEESAQERLHGHDIIAIGIGDNLAPTLKEKDRCTRALIEMIAEQAEWPIPSIYKLTRGEVVFYLFAVTKQRCEAGTREDFKAYGPEWVRHIEELEKKGQI